MAVQAQAMQVHASLYAWAVLLLGGASHLALADNAPPVLTPERNLCPDPPAPVALG